MRLVRGIGGLHATTPNVKMRSREKKKKHSFLGFVSSKGGDLQGDVVSFPPIHDSHDIR